MQIDKLAKQFSGIRRLLPKVGVTNSV